MASGRRSARAALAEMASHNARLVAAFAEKKQEARKLQGRALAGLNSPLDFFAGDFDDTHVTPLLSRPTTGQFDSPPKDSSAGAK
eukprot:9340818-Pyramimonas_sp.AAC.1